MLHMRKSVTERFWTNVVSFQVQSISAYILIWAENDDLVCRESLLEIIEKLNSLVVKRLRSLCKHSHKYNIAVAWSSKSIALSFVVYLQPHSLMSTCGLRNKVRKAYHFVGDTALLPHIFVPFHPVRCRF